MALGTHRTDSRQAPPNRWQTLLGGIAVLVAFAAGAQTAPSAPTSLTAAPLDASASLSWTDPSDSTITGYSVRSATSTTLLAAATWQAISGSGATTTSHTVSSLTNGTRYYFQIRATNAQGDSASSATATIQLAASPSTAVNIPDSALRTALETATGKSSGQTITQLDMAKLNGQFDARNLSISVVTGLEHAVNITWLMLRNNSISDVTPLGSLTALEILWLGLNQIEEVTALGNLTSLTVLTLYENRISDVTALGSLTALTWLGLSYNSISDVTALGSLTALTTLWLERNRISDVTALGSLTSLTVLSLHGNQLSDVTALGSLTALTRLELDENSITDVTPLGSLTSLTTLWLGRNRISDVTALGSLTSLTRLDLYENSITDVTPLAALTSLGTLNLRDNTITDATPLANLAALTTLYLHGNPIDSISDAPLSSLDNLVAIGLSGDWVSDSVLATIVSRYPSLTLLVLEDGSIADATPLASLSGVSWLDLSGNSISDISPLLSIFQSRPDYIDLRGNPLSAASVNRHIPDIRRRYSPVQLLFDQMSDTGDSDGEDETDDTPALPPVGNQSPSVADELPALELDVGDTVAVALRGAFDDADDDPLHYAASAVGGFVSVRIDGDAAHVTGERPGEATVTVTAADPGGLTAATSFQVAVGALLSAPASVVAREGGTAVVAVELSRAMSAAVAVRWSLVADGDDATADADADDYGEAAGEVSIPAGDTAAAIEIAIADDDDIEPAREHFVVALEQPEDGNIGLAARSRTAVAIREGVCDRTPAVRDELARGWRSCHWPKPAGLAKVRTLDLNGRGIAALRPNDLLGLRALRRLDLSDNELTELPDGLFAGLGRLGEVSLEGNPGAPFALAVELERMDAEPWMPGPARVTAKAAWGAPFALAAELEASPEGNANGLPLSVAIAAGASAGQPFRVSSANGSALALHAEAASMPSARCGDRACFRGFRLTRGSTLTLFRLPPRAMPMPEIEPLLGSELRLPLASLIEAAHALDELRWEAASSDAALATARIVDGHLVVTPELASEGTVEIALVATDAAGLSTTVRFEVRVEFHWPRDPAGGWRGAVLESAASP